MSLTLRRERLGDAAEVLGRADPDVDLAGRDRPDAQLLEVRVGGVGQAAGLRGGEDRDRAGLAVGDEVRALQRVDGDVHPRHVLAVGAGAADALADVEHRGLVPLALADDDPPAKSISSIVARMASVAAASASSLAPRPMNRADSIAAASVTRIISSASSCSISGGSAVDPVKTMARWCRSATSMAISSRMEPPGWMIAVTPAEAASWMPSGNGK